MLNSFYGSDLFTPTFLIELFRLSSGQPMKKEKNGDIDEKTHCNGARILI